MWSHPHWDAHDRPVTQEAAYNHMWTNHLDDDIEAYTHIHVQQPNWWWSTYRISPLCEWLGIEAYTIHICGSTMRILTHYIACATTVRIFWHARCECIYNNQTDIEAYIIHLCESNHLVNDPRQRMCNNHIDIEAHFNAIVYAIAKNEFEAYTSCITLFVNVSPQKNK